MIRKIIIIAYLLQDSTKCILENRLFLEMRPSTLTDSLLSPLCPPSPNGFQGVNPARRTMTDRYTNQNINNYNNQNNSQNSTHISSSFTTPKKIMSSPPRNSTFKRNSLPSVPSPPSMSPIRTCTPRTVISPRTHTSPRCKLALKRPVKHFLFDIDGTQKSRDEILRFRDVGPSTIIDKRTEYCGRYLLLPALFKNYFPLLNGTRGSIRISSRNPIDNNVVIEENDFDEIPTSHNKDDSDSDSDTDDEIEKSPISNADIEISSLGAVFIITVSGIFFLNIINGSS